jgi:hypothetical protein
MPIDLPEAETYEALTQHSDQTHQMHEQDIESAWKGLLALRTGECSDPDDDVLLLLRVLVKNPEIEASFTTQWPIKAIVAFMNAIDSHRAWDQRGVDNVKEKLARWISKKKIEYGIIAFDDFVAILVRISRKLRNGEVKGKPHGRFDDGFTRGKLQ